MSVYSIELYRDSALQQVIQVDGPVEEAQARAHAAISSNIADFVRVIHTATRRERWAERKAS